MIGSRLLRAISVLSIASLGAFAQVSDEGVRSLTNDLIQLQARLRRADASARGGIRAEANPILEARHAALTRLIRRDARLALELALPADALAEFRADFPQAAGLLETRGRWDGKVEVIAGDGVDGSTHSLTLRLHSGAGVSNLHFTGPEPGLSCDDLMGASGVLAGSELAVEEYTITSSGSLNASCSPKGEQRVAVILVNFPSAALPSGVNPELLRGIMLGNAYSSNQSSPDWSVDGFWKGNSAGQTWVSNSSGGALKVVGPYTLSQNYDFCSDSSALRKAAYAAADGDLNFVNYSRVAIVVPNYNCSGYAGYASIGCWSSECPGDGVCGTSWTWLRADQIASRSLGVRLITHEMGHNLGLGHSQSRAFSGEPLGAPGTAGTISEYGDKFNTMGSWNFGFYSGRHAANQLGWLPNAGYQTVTSNGSFSLVGYDQPSGLRALKVKRGTSNSYLWLQYLPNSGIYLSQLASQIFTGAYVTFEDSTTSSNKTQLLDFTPTSSGAFGDPALAGSWTDPYTGLTITASAPSGGTLPVTISYGSEPCVLANPAVTLSPSSISTSEGVATSYSLTVRSNDSTSCSARTFSLASSVSPSTTLITTSVANGTVTLAPGQSASTTLHANPSTGSLGSWTVTGRATAGSSNVSATAGLTVTSAGPVPPAAPAGLSANPVYSGKGKNQKLLHVALKWTDNATNENSFRIERCESADPKGTVTCTFSGTALTTVPANSTTYNDATAVAGKGYRYRVRAENSTGVSAWVEAQAKP